MPSDMPSLRSDRPKHNQALSSAPEDVLNTHSGAPNSLFDNAVFRSCSLNRQEPKAEDKKTPTRTASTFSTTTWNVSDDNVPSLPMYYSLERTSVFLPNTPASKVTGDIVGALRALPVDSKFYSGQAKAECKTAESTVFCIHLYKGRNKLNHGIFVELQRRRGGALSFREKATFILYACIDTKGVRLRPKIPSLLRSMCHFENFNGITQQCKSHPHEALLLDSDGLFPLHWVAGAASTSESHAEAIESLLEAYPDAAGMTDSEGRTPLHHACRFGPISQENDQPDVNSGITKVFDLLIKACPSAILMQDNYGVAPLNYAIKRQPSIGVLRSLLSSNPKSALLAPVSAKPEKTRKGSRNMGNTHSFRSLRSPLHFVWDNVVYYRKPWEKCPQRWKAAMFLLKTAYLGTTDFRDDDGFSKMMHAAATFHLPLRVFDYALEFHHDALSMRDSHTGLYPFMIAAANNTGSEKLDDDSELRLLNATFNLLVREPSVMKR